MTQIHLYCGKCKRPVRVHQQSFDPNSQVTQLVVSCHNTTEVIQLPHTELAEGKFLFVFAEYRHVKTKNIHPR